MAKSEYVLGASQSELHRLKFQDGVWGDILEKFFDRLKIRPNWRCLDAGCGPGFTTRRLAARINPVKGSVVGLDQSEQMLEWAARNVPARKFKHVKWINSSLQDYQPTEKFDLIVMRWVLSFPPNPGEVAAQMTKWLKKGGILAIQDYNHHGVSLFPHYDSFHEAIEATRRLYRREGGDPFIAGSIPKIFRQAGLKLIDFKSNTLCGGPKSGVFKWAGLFLPVFVPKMVEAGVLSQRDCDAFLRDWKQIVKNPAAVFFSPMICDMAGKK